MSDDIEPQEKPNAIKIHPVVEFIYSEWRTVKSVAFWIAVALATVAVFYFNERHYAGIISEKDATITQKDATIATVLAEKETFEDENGRLARENDQLRTYRGKDAPPLKQNAQNLVRQIRDFIKDWKDTDSPEKTMQNIQKYLQRFGLRASIMRDDLDQNGQHSDAFDKAMYDFQYRYSDVRIITDEVEKLAKNLPD